MAHEMTQELLKSLLHYDPETGVFTRLKVFHPRHKVGDAVVALGCSGLQYHYDGVSYNLLRLARLYMLGEMPTHRITAINKNPCDTRWSNVASGKTVPIEDRPNRLKQADFADPAKALELLQKVYSYDPESGVFSYIGKVGVARRVTIGSKAAAATCAGYERLSAYYCGFAAHKVAWLFATGAWPLHEIDHINGDKRDNRIANLRDVTRAINAQNIRQATPQSKSGLLGAHVNSNKRAKKRFRSSIKVGGACIRLGEFHTKEQAHEAYVNAKRRLHAGCTI